MPITRHLNAIVPAILVSGVISLGLILLQLGCGRDEEEEEDDEEDEECGDEGCVDDPSVQGKVAKKLEPMLNVMASATDVELWWWPVPLMSNSDYDHQQLNNSNTAIANYTRPVTLWKNLTIMMKYEKN